MCITFERVSLAGEALVDPETKRREVVVPIKTVTDLRVSNIGARDCTTTAADPVGARAAAMARTSTPTGCTNRRGMLCSRGRDFVQDRKTPLAREISLTRAAGAGSGCERGGG